MHAAFGEKLVAGRDRTQISTFPPPLLTPCTFARRRVLLLYVTLHRAWLQVGACLYWSPDPIDAFTVTWRQSRADQGSAFGLVLRTEQPVFDKAKNREARVGPNSAQGQGEKLVENINSRVNKWFDWRAVGGGQGYVRRYVAHSISCTLAAWSCSPVTTCYCLSPCRFVAHKLHFGDVELQIVRNDYTHMEDAAGRPAPNATQLVPQYMNTQV